MLLYYFYFLVIILLNFNDGRFVIALYLSGIVALGSASVDHYVRL